MKKRSSGFSLVEMLVVISVGTVLTGLAVTTLAGMLHASRAMNEHVYRIATIRRLAEQFRDDVHAALASRSLSEKDLGNKDPKDKGLAGKGVEEKGRPTAQRFDLAPNHVVTYTLQQGVVDRTEEVDHVVRSRDSFFLPGKCVASITPSTDLKGLPAGATVLALILAPSATVADEQGTAAQTAAPRSGRSSVRIEAVLARDRRFTKPK
jgi:prepilin-type N-terminal cleavage/methylation domain-containing protein